MSGGGHALEIEEEKRNEEKVELRGARERERIGS